MEDIREHDPTKLLRRSLWSGQFLAGGALAAAGAVALRGNSLTTLPVAR